MLRNTHTGIAPSAFPTLASLRQRRAELLDLPAQPQAQPPDPDPPSRPDPPPQLSANPVLGEAALYGVAGLAIRALAPHTEAHPAAILLQLLAAFGNAAGPGPHCMVDATRHGLNLFVVLVGESSKARKGTSWNQIRRLFSEVDLPWVTERVTTARLTCAALIHDLRGQQPATDRRLLALSEEFAALLHSLGRAKGPLSPMLRCAWDSGDLRALDGRRPIQATGTHISLIAHITQRELAQNLHPTEAHNGFANRCLWTGVHRGQCLPEGGNMDPHEHSAVAAELRRALDWAHNAGSIRLTRDDEARALWHERYPDLSQVRPACPGKPWGLYGAATSRAEAQVLRLSAIYAVLDCSSTIRLPHLEAALAVWEYCSAGASLLFGTSTGDPTADRIREAINASSDGLSRKQISALFHGHLSSERIEAALEQLMSLDAIQPSREPGGAAPPPSGPPYQKRNSWARKRWRMNQQPRTQRMRNQCRSRLSQHSSLSSHISAQALILVPSRAQQLKPSKADRATRGGRATQLSQHSSLSSHISAQALILVPSRAQQPRPSNADRATRGGRVTHPG